MRSVDDDKHERHLARLNRSRSRRVHSDAGEATQKEEDALLGVKRGMGFSGNYNTESRAKYEQKAKTTRKMKEKPKYLRSGPRAATRGGSSMCLTSPR